MANAVNLPGERLAGLWEDLAHKVRKGVITLDEFALFNQRKDPFSGNFRIVIDYGQSLEQMIAAGWYDWKSDGITGKNFPVSGQGVVEFETRHFHFDSVLSSEDAIKLIEKAGWGPARIEHVLAFGAKYPEEQRKFPIIGLGSVARVDGGRLVPCLNRSDSKRFLILYWFAYDWSSVYRFLAVRKISGS